LISNHQCSRLRVVYKRQDFTTLAPKKIENGKLKKNSKFYSHKISRGKKDYKSFVLSSNIVTNYKKDYSYFFVSFFVCSHVCFNHIMNECHFNYITNMEKHHVHTHAHIHFYTNNPIFNSTKLYIYIYKEWCIYVCLGCSYTYLLPNLTTLLLSPTHLHEKAHHHLPFLCQCYLYIKIDVCFLLFVCDQAFHYIFGIVGKPLVR